MEKEQLIAKGLVERIGLPEPKIYHKSKEEEVTKVISCATHEEAVDYVLTFFDINTIKAVAHRVVHGGEQFRRELIIDTEVESQIEKLSKLAPLHNPANLIGIRASKKKLTAIPHIAVFDTSFHATIPEYAYRYAISGKWYEENSFRRYGFHGTSIEYVTNRTRSLLSLKKSKKLIVLHLGNGASVTAVYDGKSIDTSMGLTPLEGLIMGTRSGDIDPGLILAMMRSGNLTIDQIDQELNSRSGLLGITGNFRDMRDIQESALKGSHSAELAVQMAAYRIRKYIGAYLIALGGLDAIVFTGGIGERSSYFRRLIVKGLNSIDVSIDISKNEGANGEEEVIISSSESKIEVVVIPTDEEYMMALKTKNLLESAVL